MRPGWDRLRSSDVGRLAQRCGFDRTSSRVGDLAAKAGRLGGVIGPLVGASFSEVTRLIDVLAWPAVVVFAVAVAASDRGRRLLRPVLRRIRKVAGPGGFALELSEEAAAATKADVEGAIRDFSGALQDEFDRLAYAEDVRNRLSAAVRDLLDGHDLPDGHDYRATVHIRDALYADALYQLVDYWPRGRGAGRRFPERSGMLGKHGGSSGRSMRPTSRPSARS